MSIKRTAKRHSNGGSDGHSEIPEDVLGPREPSFFLEPVPRRLSPRPEQGLSFDEAEDTAMRDHRAVFAALAK